MLHDILEIETLTPMQASYLTEAHDHVDFGRDAVFAEEVRSSESDEGFTDRLLTALATMAARSKRRQADLSAALRRGGLDSEPSRVSRALSHLVKIGCIEHLVPLYDGGVLMSVTSRGIERLTNAPRWALLDVTGFQPAHRAY